MRKSFSPGLPWKPAGAVESAFAEEAVADSARDLSGCELQRFPACGGKRGGDGGIETSEFESGGEVYHFLRRGEPFEPRRG